MEFEAVLGRWRREEPSQLEAAEILGLSERSFRRWYQRYEEDGLDGLSDRRLGKPSPKRVPEGWADRVEQLYRERYAGFNARHFWEHLVKDHGFPFSYSWAKSFLHRRQLVPLVGMLLHQDGSRHRRVPGLEAELDLIVTMDDASNQVYSAFLVEEEGTMSSFACLRDVIGKQGLFCTLYTDRGSHYFETREAGGKGEGICAAMATTGTRERWQSNRPLIRCRFPGPQRPAQTAKRPVTCASLNAAGPAQRVGKAVQAVALDSIDPLDARGGKRLDHLIGNGCHGFTPS